VGQAVSRQGAAALVRNLPYVTEPVDGQLKSWWEAGVFPFGLTPYCVTTDLDGGNEAGSPRKNQEQDTASFHAPVVDTETEP
jgi:hypothetical protein